MAPEVVLLDVDGTLVDSNDAHAQSWIEALSERGIDVEFQDLRRLIGMGGDKLLPKLTGIPLDDPRGEALSKRRTHIFRDRHLPKLRAFPKVRELLEAFHSNGLERVVTTSAKKEESQALLEHAGIADLIDDVTTSDDLKSKPDGDIVVAALKRAKLPPGKAMMLGDTPYDISSAKAAGVRCVALRTGGWKDEDLKDAIAIYDDAATLLRKLDRSPFVRAR
ncbi:MAG: HAD family hydrolase [Polyangiales bacterium]